MPLIISKEINFLKLKIFEKIFGKNFWEIFFFKILKKKLIFFDFFSIFWKNWNFLILGLSWTEGGIDFLSEALQIVLATVKKKKKEKKKNPAWQSKARATLATVPAIAFTGRVRVGWGAPVALWFQQQAKPRCFFLMSTSMKKYAVPRVTWIVVNGVSQFLEFWKNAQKIQGCLQRQSAIDFVKFVDCFGVLGCPYPTTAHTTGIPVVLHALGLQKSKPEFLNFFLHFRECKLSPRCPRTVQNKTVPMALKFDPEVGLFGQCFVFFLLKFYRGKIQRNSTKSATLCLGAFLVWEISKLGFWASFTCFYSIRVAPGNQENVLVKRNGEIWVFMAVFFLFFFGKILDKTTILLFFSHERGMTG